MLNGYYDVCVLNLTRDVTTRLTSDSVGKSHPLWGPCGEQVAYASWVTGTLNVFTKPAHGRRFAVAEPMAGPRKPSIHVVQNWFAEFRHRAKPAR